MRTNWRIKLKIVKALNKDINMNFGLGKCARMCLTKGRVQGRIIWEARLRRILKNWTREKHRSI